MCLKGNKISKTVLIQAAPAIIFKALTDGRDLARWFCDRATSNPIRGGELQATWRAGKKTLVGRAVFSELTPDESVELQWVDDGVGTVEQNATHILTFTIRTRNNLSEVFMCDRDETVPDEETLIVLQEGWNSVLLELKDYCENKERSGKGSPKEAL